MKSHVRIRIKKGQLWLWLSCCAPRPEAVGSNPTEFIFQWVFSHQGFRWLPGFRELGNQGERPSRPK
jgi:hypothetical protein